MKPTVFVDIDSHGGPDVVARAIKAVADVFGAEIAEQLVSGEVEADIAVTNSVGIALRMTKETERTRIVLVHFGRREREEALAFAARYTERVTAVPGVGMGRGDEVEIAPFLLKLITEKTKEG